MSNETKEERVKRIVSFLNETHPGKEAYDLDGRGLHFVCEVEPVSEHPEYDRAIEVIIDSKPHKHLKMTQTYTMHSGILELHVGEKTVTLEEGDTYVVEPGSVHWATSEEAVVEIYSEPGWTKEDHIVVEKE